MEWLIIILCSMAGTLLGLLILIIVGVKKIDNMYKELEELHDLEDDNDVL